MYRKGIILAILTAIISGVSIFSNGIFVTKTDPVVFALVRNVAVAILLTVLVIGTKSLKELKGLKRGEWGKLLFIGAIGGGIPFAMFFTGLSMIGAVNGNAINKTLFVWIALLAIPFLRERVSRLQMVGYGIILLGMFATSGTLTLGNNPGTWLVLGATILWAIEHVIAKVALQSIPALVVGWGRIVFGLPFLLFAVVLLGKVPALTQAATYAWTPILISSILLTGYITSWYTAIKYAPVTLVSSILVVAPVITAVLSSVVLQKLITRQQSLQHIILTLGVACITWVALRSQIQKV